MSQKCTLPGQCQPDEVCLRHRNKKQHYFKKITSNTWDNAKGAVCPITVPYLCPHDEDFNGPKCAPDHDACKISEQSVRGYSAQVFSDTLGQRDYFRVGDVGILENITINEVLERRYDKFTVLAKAHSNLNGLEIMLKANAGFGHAAKNHYRTEALQSLIAEYEAHVYMQLSNYSHALPNIVRAVAYESIPMTVDELLDRIYKASSKPPTFAFYKAVYDNVSHLTDLPIQTLDILATEYQGPNVISLKDIIRSKTLSTNAFRSIMFQVLYTLSVMFNTGIQHNDLHLDNILIDTFSSVDSIEYTTPFDTFIVPVSDNFVMLFDWDFAVNENICGTNNPVLTQRRCATTGECASINPNFDIYRIFRSLELVVMYLPYDCRLFINRVLANSETWKQKEKIDGRLCKQNELGNCVAFTQPLFGLLTPMDALMDTFFDDFRKKSFLSDHIQRAFEVGLRTGNDFSIVYAVNVDSEFYSLKLTMKFAQKGWNILYESSSTRLKGSKYVILKITNHERETFDVYLDNNGDEMILKDVHLNDLSLSEKMNIYRYYLLQIFLYSFKTSEFASQHFVQKEYMGLYFQHMLENFAQAVTDKITKYEAQQLITGEIKVIC